MSILEDRLLSFEEARRALQTAQNSLVEVLEGEFISCLEEYSLGFWVDEEDECEEKAGLWYYEPNMREWAAESLGLLYYLNPLLNKILSLPGAHGDTLYLYMERRYLPDAPPEGMTFVLLEEARETGEIKKVALDAEKIPADYPDYKVLYHGPVSENLADAILEHPLRQEALEQIPVYSYSPEYKRLIRESARNKRFTRC